MPASDIFKKIGYTPPKKPVSDTPLVFLPPKDLVFSADPSKVNKPATVPIKTSTPITTKPGVVVPKTQPVSLSPSQKIFEKIGYKVPEVPIPIVAKPGNSYGIGNKEYEFPYPKLTDLTVFAKGEELSNALLTPVQKQKVAQTTPQVSDLPSLKSTLKKLFVEPVKVRAPFEKPEDATTFAFGGKALGAATDISRTLFETPFRIGAFMLGNIATMAGDENYELPFDARRLGFEDQKVDSGSRYIKAIQDSGWLDDPSLKNLPKATVAALLTAGFDILDVIGAGQTLRSMSRAVIKNVAVPEAEHIAAWRLLGRADDAEEAVTTGKKLLSQLSNETNNFTTGNVKEATAIAKNITNAMEVLRKQGVPKNPGAIAQSARNVARFIDSDLNQILNFGLGDEIQTPFARPYGYLPGTAIEPGQAAPVGLSTRRVTKVGGARPETVNVNRLGELVDNTLDKNKTGIREPSIKFFLENPQEITAKPIKIREVEGRLIIEDGRHRLEAARQLGIDNIPYEDVTSFYPAVEGQVGQTSKILANISNTPVDRSIRTSTGQFAGSTPKEFEGFDDITTKTLDELKGRDTVSKQFISDLIKKPDLKKAEKDIIQSILDQYPEGSIPVRAFAEKVRTELLPLDREVTNLYEGVALRDETRGPVDAYEAHIYQSPIPVNAGNIHFSGEGYPNYFAHARVEDMQGLTMKEGTTRRVLEIQSDLFQKGRLEGEKLKVEPETIDYTSGEKKVTPYQKIDRSVELAPLEPFKNTWHERVIREEIKQAAIDGKTKLQFPTGETAMKIEGLGEIGRWTTPDPRGGMMWVDATPQNLKVGQQINQWHQGGPRGGLGDEWIITDVLGDGKFKAIPRSEIDNSEEALTAMGYAYPDDAIDALAKGKKDIKDFIDNEIYSMQETFDISGKVDTNNPIYKFYENTVQKYVKRIAPDMRRITDEQGVEWFEINVPKDAATKPIQAFKENIAGIDFDITPEEGVKLIRSMFTPDEVKFVYTPEFMRTVINGKETTAAGLFSKRQDIFSDQWKSMIKIVEQNGLVSSDTIYHEAFHAYVNNFIPKEELLAIKKSVREKLPYITSDYEAEEWLADDFARYSKSQFGDNPPKYKGFLRELWEKVLNKVREWIRRSDKIQDTYNAILLRRRPSDFSNIDNEIIAAKVKKETLQNISKEPEPLTQEARKYKSAEEFIKSIDNQGDKSFWDPGVGVKTETGKPIILKGFHGTTKQFDKFTIPKEGTRYTGDGVYFYPGKSAAEGYTGGKGRVVESYLDLKKPYNLYLPEGNIDYQPGSEIINNIKNQGYDSIVVRIKDIDTKTKKIESDFINEIVVFDTNAIKTKSQLIDIWNGANGEITAAKEIAPLEGYDSSIEVMIEDADDAMASFKAFDNIDDIIDIKKFNYLQELQVKRDILSSEVAIHPAKFLMKYTDGQGNLAEVTGRGRGIFSRRGDDMVTEYGYKDLRDAQRGVDEYRRMKQELEDTTAALKEGRPFLRQMKAAQRFLDKNTPMPSEVIPEMTTLAKTADLKDIGNVSKGFKDIYRNFETVFGKHIEQVKKTVLDPFDDAKKSYINMQKDLIAEMKTEIVDKLKIKRGSKDSALVMDYGEGLLQDFENLVQHVGGDRARAQRIADAAKWFRGKYDMLIDDINKVRKELYPNNPEKLIPFRKDYFRHFKEMTEGVEGLKNIFDTPAGIDPNLAGLSDFTSPRTKFLSLAMRRVGINSARDAVGGFLDYIPSAAYAKHIDPQIGVMRRLRKQLVKGVEQTETPSKINNFIEFLHDFANDLAGKTNPADRSLQKWIPGGRTTMKVINWINGRVKSNVILGNFSSSIAQAFNLPQGIAHAKQYTIPGMKKTLVGIFNENVPMSNSQFITERYFTNARDQFPIDFGNHPFKASLNETKKFAIWMIGALDEASTKLMWNSFYEKAIAENIEDPIRYADEWARKMVAGRGIGEVPLAQKSQIGKIIMPFQLELTNLWWVMKDQVSRRDFTGIALFLVSSFVMNRAAEELRGSDVSFDPINAFLDGVREFQTEEDWKRGVTLFFGRLSGEVISNAPLGQTLASFYPEYGWNIPGVGNVTRKEFFGDGDPTRFGGTGLLAQQAYQDPLYKLLPPFAGNQIKKTVEGVTSFMKGRNDSASGQSDFDIKQTPINFVKSLLFGKYSTQDARDFFERTETPEAKIIRQEKEKAKEKGDVVKQDAENVYRAIMDAPQDQRKQMLLDLAKSDPAIAEKVLDIADAEKKGLTYVERQLQSAGIENGSRAAAMVRILDRMPTKDQQKEQLKLWVQKKLVTDEVLDQILNLREKKNKGDTAYAASIEESEAAVQEAGDYLDKTTPLQHLHLNMKTKTDGTSISSPKDRGFFGTVKEFLLDVKDKIPFFESRLGKALKEDALKKYNFTDSAKKYLRENTKISTNIPEIDDAMGIYSDGGVVGVGLPEWGYGGLSHQQRVADLIPGGNDILYSEFADNWGQALGDLLYQPTGGKNQIEIRMPSVQIVAHELLHGWVEKSGKFDYKAFNEAWEETRRSDKRIDAVDTIIGNSGLYDGVDEYHIANERFAYMGQTAGYSGLTHIPEILKPFYTDIFAEE